MRLASLAAALVAAGVSVCAGGGPAAAQYGNSRCIVTDPTGTPLNIRDRPQGRVIGSLRNGTYVRLVDIAYDGGGRPWGYVVNWNTGQAIGWVFRSYISCY